MAYIAIEGMRFHAYHGVHEEERRTGADYLVDVYVQVDIAEAAKEDNIEKTVNYETIYRLCQMEMSQPRKLLETVVSSIVERMKKQFDKMIALKVCVRKLSPPLGGQVACVYVQEEVGFIAECPRCRKQFINYSPKDCWERFPNLHPATKETLLRQFGGKCLCDKCLQFYAG
ncbi:MAG: dihydroneopterin aldolase [Saprospiraceae bacterium]|nr:dihydroneopterin aldolase [Saprospiraceae bacterium]MDW8228449.1 dihydroneopterin aldolase [Saprospiraceae bacterium]